MRGRTVFVMVTAAVLFSTLAGGASLSDEIPFKLVRGFGIVVRGEIGSVSNLNFLFDTGAVPSVLSERVASRIGVAGPKGSFALLDKNLTAEYVTVKDVRFGWVQANALPMVVLDLEGLSNVLGIRIDAIVGLDAVDRQPFSIDYKHRRITSRLSGSARHVLPVEIYLREGAPYWVLPVTLGGQTFRVLLDTGADDLALFAGHAGRPLGDTESDSIRPVKVTGEIETRAMKSSLMLMGDASFQKQLVVEMANPRGTALPEIDGVLGPTAVGITRVEFDWDHMCMRWDAE
jgi:predicted aspartyl protease